MPILFHSGNKRQFKLCSKSVSNYQNQSVEAEKLFKKSHIFAWFHCIQNVSTVVITPVETDNLKHIYPFFATLSIRQEWCTCLAPISLEPRPTLACKCVDHVRTSGSIFTVVIDTIVLVDRASRPKKPSPRAVTVELVHIVKATSSILTFCVIASTVINVCFAMITYIPRSTLTLVSVHHIYAKTVQTWAGRALVHISLTLSIGVASNADANISIDLYHIRKKSKKKNHWAVSQENPPDLKNIIFRKHQTDALCPMALLFLQSVLGLILLHLIRLCWKKKREPFVSFVCLALQQHISYWRNIQPFDINSFLLNDSIVEKQKCTKKSVLYAFVRPRDVQ